VTSREETISNVVTPGVDDLNPSTTVTTEVTPTEEPQSRGPKKVDVVQPITATEEQDLELTTYFTTVRTEYN